MCTKRFALLLIASCLPLFGQMSKSDVLKHVDTHKLIYEAIALKIWDYAEIGYKEVKSSALLKEQLTKEGFKVESGVAAIPTAFVATYGSGKPIIGILAEYDALPGFSQEAVPEKKERPDAQAGHACGHNLFGTASVQAAVAVKAWIKSKGSKGTIRVYGTPAEEGGSGKVYMVRAGLFDDVDVAVHWHPGDRNAVSLASTLANKSGKFRFHGIASHAAGSPDRGRSALDGVEAMNHMVNLMREHVPDSARLHYVITRGGEAPNVVPAFAEVYYYVRSPNREVVADIWKRVEQAATGAALGTGTTVDWEVTGGVYEILPNEVLGRVMHENLSAVGGVNYTPEERAFAMKIGQTVFGKPPAPEAAAIIVPFNPNPPRESGGSTDVGDVSWVVPTVGLRAAAFAPGTPGHSWQAVACGGSTLGLKGMNVAAKSMAGTLVDLMTKPDLITQATAEFTRRRGSDFKYVALLGDRPPALNYRD